MPHVLVPDPQPDFDLQAASEWIDAELDAELEEDNARYTEMFDAEKEVALELQERARAQGLVPEGATLERMIELQEAEHLRLLDYFEQAAPDIMRTVDEYGTLRQAMPVPTAPFTKRPPYSTETEDQKDGGTDKSFADKADGRLRVRPDTSFSGDFDWARASIGQHFKAPVDNGSFAPNCRFQLIADFVTAWGLFSPATVSLDIHVHTFNVTQNRRFVNRRTRGTVVNAWIGVVGQTLGLPNFFSQSGFGQVNKGDNVIVTATAIGRAKSPTGRGALNFDCRLQSITI